MAFAMRLSPARRALYGAAVLAPALATYTAVLLADTAVPSWNAAYPDLPFVFAGSALASRAGVGRIAAPGTRTIAASAVPLRKTTARGSAKDDQFHGGKIPPEPVPDTGSGACQSGQSISAQA